MGATKLHTTHFGTQLSRTLHGSMCLLTLVYVIAHSIVCYEVQYNVDDVVHWNLHQPSSV